MNKIGLAYVVLFVGWSGCGGGPSTSGSGGAGGATGGTSASTGGSGATGAAGQSGTGGSAGTTGTAGTTGSAGRGGTGGAGGGGGAVCTNTTIPSCSRTTSPYSSNGWVVNGSWKGYADVFNAGFGSFIIAPSGFDLSDNYLCPAGAVGAGSNPEAQEGFQWNVNQAMSPPNAPAMSVTPTGAGLTINAPGTTTSMRVNLNDGTTTWCAYLPQANGGTIPWSSFKTECWPGGQGTAYAMQPFLSIQIGVPARETDPTCFCFCVVSISPTSI
jgi:hypothetical protein